MVCAAQYFRTIYTLQDRSDITGCATSCLREIHEVNVMEDFTRNLGNKTDFFVFYGSTTVQVDTEYVLFDANAIVASVGGSLGLFLGFSCWQFVLSMPGTFQWLKARRQTVFKV